jgi:hypothetical protein
MAHLGTTIAVVAAAMKAFEYILSLVVALLLLAGAAVWTQATHDHRETAMSCRSGRPGPPVFVKGMSVHPRCPSAKRG